MMAWAKGGKRLKARKVRQNKDTITSVFPMPNPRPKIGRDRGGRVSRREGRQQHIKNPGEWRAREHRGLKAERSAADHRQDSENQTGKSSVVNVRTKSAVPVKNAIVGATPMSRMHGVEWKKRAKRTPTKTMCAKGKGSRGGRKVIGQKKTTQPNPNNPRNARAGDNEKKGRKTESGIR